MDNREVSDILTNFRSYRYAAKMGQEQGHLDAPPTVYNERRKSVNRWDASRYTRIVAAVTGAIDEVLTDEQRAVINRRYIDRNPMTLGEIADHLHVNKNTVTNRHKEALKQLGIALEPLSEDSEITPFEHMFITVVK